MTISNTSLSFSSLALANKQIDNLKALGYQEMLPIQAASLPSILAGKDVVAQAQTGSGKTLAFGLGIMHKLDPQLAYTQAIVLNPTRELAHQTSNVLRQLARPLGSIKILQLTGGSSVQQQEDSLEQGAHIVVGTPGRILDLIQRDALKLNKINTLVLDEADHMLDMGFYEDISEISLNCPLKRQTLLFSATFPAELLKQSEGFLINPEHIKLASQSLSSRFKQYFYLINEKQRMASCAQILKQFKPQACLIFCTTRQDTEALSQYLNHQEIYNLALHGQHEQRQREDTLIQFANQSCQVLVATDVAARGLDLEAIDLVINYNPAPNTEIHVHRIGRTSRNQDTGHVINLINESEKYKVKLLEDALNFAAQWKTWEDNDHKTSFSKFPTPPMRTLCIHGGKKDKLSAGDILGALTKELGLQANSIGKITRLSPVSFVAIDQEYLQKNPIKQERVKIKKRHFKIRFIDSW